MDTITMMNTLKENHDLKVAMIEWARAFQEAIRNNDTTPLHKLKYPEGFTQPENEYE